MTVSTPHLNIVHCVVQVEKGFSFFCEFLHKKCGYVQLKWTSQKWSLKKISIQLSTTSSDFFYILSEKSHFCWSLYLKYEFGDSKNELFTVFGRI